MPSSSDSKLSTCSREGEQDSGGAVGEPTEAWWDTRGKRLERVVPSGSSVFNLSTCRGEAQGRAWDNLVQTERWLQQVLGLGAGPERGCPVLQQHSPGRLTSSPTPPLGVGGRSAPANPPQPHVGLRWMHPPSPPPSQRHPLVAVARLQEGSCTHQDTPTYPSSIHLGAAPPTHLGAPTPPGHPPACRVDLLQEGQLHPPRHPHLS